MYEPLPVSSAQVARYEGLVEHYATRFAQLEEPLAEFDDLMQVGRIRVWTLLRRGIRPTGWSVEHAIKDEMRRCRARNGDGTDLIPDDLDAEFLALDGVGD